MSGGYRAGKSGFAAEVQDKLSKSYSPERAGDILRWINLKTNLGLCTDGSPENFHEVLSDGVVLCKLLNCLAGRDVVKKISTSKMAFKKMENVNFFLENSKSHFGVPDEETFPTISLTESQNLSQVVICLESLQRKVGEGIKEATANKRDFTEEQLRAGDSVIGLQMGTNKGASQKGMNIGNTRHIID